MADAHHKHSEFLLTTPQWSTVKVDWPIAWCFFFLLFLSSLNWKLHIPALRWGPLVHQVCQLILYVFLLFFFMFYFDFVFYKKKMVLIWCACSVWSVLIASNFNFSRFISNAYFKNVTSNNIHRNIQIFQTYELMVMLIVKAVWGLKKSKKLQPYRNALCHLMANSE